MNLLIDIGNSSLKYAFDKNTQLSAIERVSNGKLSTTFFNKYWQDVSKIIFASVAAESIGKEIIHWARINDISIEQIFTPPEKFGIKVGYENHHQLGVDRWLTFIGTVQLYPRQNCLIIDLGTASTIDLITSTGKHNGGWIFPGIETMYQSLLTNTANITLTDKFNPQIHLATNTHDNVINGCFAATVGAIEMAIKQAQKTNTQIDKLIFTGGHAKVVSEYFGDQSVVIDDLVFQGLARYSKKT